MVSPESAPPSPSLAPEFFFPKLLFCGELLLWGEGGGGGGGGRRAVSN